MIPETLLTFRMPYPLDRRKNRHRRCRPLRFEDVGGRKDLPAELGAMITSLYVQGQRLEVVLLRVALWQASLGDRYMTAAPQEVSRE